MTISPQVQITETLFKKYNFTMRLCFAKVCSFCESCQNLWGTDRISTTELSFIKAMTLLQIAILPGLHSIVDKYVS